MRAMIMAAGLGTRLLPLTAITPKPMVPILGRPILAHILALLRRLEREQGHRPRIGRSIRRAQDIADIGQDPQLAFPAQELREVDALGDRARIRAQDAEGAGQRLAVQVADGSGERRRQCTLMHALAHRAGPGLEAVSYTHLTLPTSYSV